MRVRDNLTLTGAMLIKRCMGLIVLTVFISAILINSPRTVSAQVPSVTDLYDVFASSTINATKNSAGQSGFYFVNLRTGLSNIVLTNSTRSTLFNDGVLYQDVSSGVAMMAYPDGRTAAFSPIAITASSPTMKANWVISTNRKWIAWTVSDKQDLSLLSDLYVAAADVTNGVSNTKLVLHTSSTKGIDTIPLAITDDGTTVFYARQALTPESQIYQLFSGYSDVFKLDVASGQATELPGKTDDKNPCLCAVGFSTNGDLFVRLLPAGDDNYSFKAHFWRLSIQRDSEIAAPNIAHRQAGYMLASRDGNLIAYTSARGVPPAKNVPPERYAIVVIDLARSEQRVVASLLKVNLRPLSFSPDNSTLMLVGTDTNGTYKLNLTDGNLLQVSGDTYLGTLGG